MSGLLGCLKSYFDDRALFLELSYQRGLVSLSFWKSVLTSDYLTYPPTILFNSRDLTLDESLCESNLKLNSEEYEVRPQDSKFRRGLVQS